MSDLISRQAAIDAIESAFDRETQNPYYWCKYGRKANI